MRYAGVSYFDRTRALERGEVRPSGIDLTFVPFDVPGDLFREMAQRQPYEAAEMSLSTYLQMVGGGDDRLVGIPVFPSRAFRHGQIYVAGRSEIETASELVGRNVGVPEYSMTAALWIRSFLQHDYGVAPDRLHWWVGGLKTPGYVERLRHDPPPGVTIDRIPDDHALEPMLAAGELDALVTTSSPEPYFGRGEVQRLFADFRAAETEYYRRTRIFPIMHLVVVRRDVYEANRFVAGSLLQAFEDAKQHALARLRQQGTAAVMHPWLPLELDRVWQEFGGDPYVYGFRENVDVLREICTFSHEQGLSPRTLDPAELFAPETLEWKAEAPAVKV